MTHPGTSLLVLADDLTGLAEIAGLVADRGARGIVYTSPRAFVERAEPASALLFVNLACRTKTGPDAQRALADVIASVGPARPARIYLKLDSVARGPVAWLLNGLCQALDAQHVPLLLANPSQRRATCEGTLYVAGTRLDETPFRTDPVHPAREAFLPAILTAALDLEVVLGGTASDAGQGVIHVLDGGSQEDMVRQGEAWKSTQIAAGAAPFGVELICHWLGPRREQAEPRRPLDFQRTLIVVGTRHPAGSALVDEFRNHGGTVCLASPLLTDPRLPLLIQPPAAAADPRSVLATLTTTATRLYESLRPQILFLVGGETAQSLTTSLRIAHATPLGYTCGTARLDFADPDQPAPVQLLVKPGSYEQPRLLGKIFSLADSNQLPGR